MKEKKLMFWLSFKLVKKKLFVAIKVLLLFTLLVFARPASPAFAQTCDLEGDTCCPGGVCSGALVCSNDNLCVVAEVNPCDQVCRDGTFPFGACTLGGNPDPANCSRPPAPDTFFDCSIAGSPWDCYCCNYFRPFLPPPSTPRPTLPPLPTIPLPPAGTGVPIGDSFGSPIGRTVQLADLVSIILWNAVVIAGIIMLILMIGGGIGIIVGAGRGSPEAAAKGRQAVTAAVIGFIIIFATYWIIQIVEILTGLEILNPVL